MSNLDELISLVPINNQICERHDFYANGKILGIYNKTISNGIIDTFEYVEKEYYEDIKCVYR